MWRRPGKNRPAVAGARDELGDFAREVQSFLNQYVVARHRELIDQRQGLGASSGKGHPPTVVAPARRLHDARAANLVEKASKTDVIQRVNHEKTGHGKSTLEERAPLEGLVNSESKCA